MRPRVASTRATLPGPQWASGRPTALELDHAEFDALVLGLPWQRLQELQRICWA